MDIRTVKTNRDLKNAYLELSAQMLPSMITVAELSKAALVNKTTFYRHYKDIDEFADLVEQEAFDNFIQGLNDSDKLLTDPKSFLTSLMGHMFANESDLLVFRGKQDSLLAKLANFLSDTYLNEESSQEEESVEDLEPVENTEEPENKVEVIAVSGHLFHYRKVFSGFFDGPGSVYLIIDRTDI